MESCLIHPGDINWFITTDETWHPFSSKGHKGGSTSVWYATNLFTRSGKPVVSSSSHTTGVYGTTGAGYPLPCIVMSLNAKEEGNFQINPKVDKGLPISRGKYANNTYMSAHSSFIAI